MRKRFRKGTAVVLATCMVLGSTMLVSAADQGFTTGEGIVNVGGDDIISVKVPTTTAFNFDVDGGKRLHASDSTKYADATLLFANGKATSDVITVTNRSTCAVDVVFTGTIAANGATVATSAITNTSTPTDATIYFALDEVADEDGTALGTANTQILSASGSALVLKMASDEGNYTASKGDPDANGISKWIYSRKEDATAGQKNYFVMQGNASEQGWDAATVTAAPKVTVTYRITTADKGATATAGSADDLTDSNVQDVAPSVDEAVMWSAVNGAVINVNLGSGDLGATNYTLTWSKDKQTYKNQDAGENNYTISADKKKITVSSGFYPTLAENAKLYMKIVFNDAARTTKTVVLTKTLQALNAAPSVDETGTLSATSGGTIHVDLGSGELGATDYTLTWSKDNSSFKNQTPGADNYTISSDKTTITLSSAFYATVAPNAKIYMKIVFNDAAATTKTVVITKTE